MPSTASIVQDKLGAKRAGAVDLNAACSGFAYAFNMGAAQIESGRARQVMVIGADELSIYLDWKDRSTCILFGDGAGAVVLPRRRRAGHSGVDDGLRRIGRGTAQHPRRRLTLPQ